MTFCVADSKIDALVKVNKTQKQLLYFLLKSKAKFNLDKCIQALQISSRTFYRNVEVLLDKNLITKSANTDKIYHNESDVIYQLEPNFENDLRALLGKKEVTKCHTSTANLSHDECQNVTSPTYIYKNKNRGRIENNKTPNPLKGADVFFEGTSSKTTTKNKKQDENNSHLSSQALQVAKELNNTNEDFISKVSEFLSLRAKKHKITEAYISDFINELKQIPSPLSALNKCIAKGWITCEKHYFTAQSTNTPNANHKYLAPNLQKLVDNNELSEAEAHAEQNYAKMKALWLDATGQTKGAYEAIKNEIKKGASNEKRLIDGFTISL